MTTVHSAPELTPPDRIIDAQQARRLAEAWAQEAGEPGVHTDVWVYEAAEGWDVELVVYEGEGPFQALGTSTARITRRGVLVAA